MNSGNVGFMARTSAGIIDLIVILVLAFLMKSVLNSFVERNSYLDLLKIKRLRLADINERYRERFRLPKMDSAESLMLCDVFIGLESERISSIEKKSLETKALQIWNEEILSSKITPEIAQKEILRRCMKSSKHLATWPCKYDDAIYIRTKNKIILAFPKDTSPSHIEDEEKKFLSQYGEWINAGTPVERFRKAFPEFSYISDYNISDAMYNKFYSFCYENKYEFFERFIDSSKEKSSVLDYLMNGELLLILIYLIYFFTGLFCLSGSLGKMALGIRVINKNGTEIKCAKIFAYIICSFITISVTLFSCFIPLLFKGEKKALHDKICDVVLVKEIN